jgi:DNA primase
VRNASRYADFLIERARTEFGVRTPEAKVKALNFLLPHIRRIPNPIARNDFAENAAQKLGIESSLMRQELKQAAQQRLESVRAPQPRAVTEVERILLCALVLPDADSARALAAESLSLNPQWYSELPSAAVIEVLVNGPAPENPFEAAPDDASRALLASALHTAAEASPDDTPEINAARVQRTQAIDPFPQQVNVKQIGRMSEMLRLTPKAVPSARNSPLTRAFFWVVCHG